MGSTTWIDGVALILIYAINVGSQSLREQSIARAIINVDGVVQFQYAGPDWAPQSVRGSLFDRVVRDGRFPDRRSPDQVLHELSKLRSLEILDLDDVKIGDSALQHLRSSIFAVRKSMMRD